MVLLEGLDELKNPVISGGTEPATFGLVAYCLNQPRYSDEDVSKNVRVMSVKRFYFSRFRLFTAVTVTSTLFWDVTPYSL
jgi:hypothetical protein